MSTVIVGKGGTLGTLLAERLAVSAIEVRSPDPRDDTPLAALSDADVVINAGGPRVRKGLSWEDYFREHVGVTTRIARSMRAGAHLVHLSSTAVFGARGALLSSADHAAPTLFPSAAYACAKLAAELAARAIGRERGLAVTVLRPSMVYGPGVDSALDSMRRLARRGVVLHLTPRRLRQHLTHVELLVAAVRACVTMPTTTERVLLVADPFVLRNDDIVVRGHGLPIPIALDLVTRARAFASIPAMGGAFEALRVLAMDNEFDCRAMFDALRLDPARHAREHTFDPYWRNEVAS